MEEELSVVAGIQVEWRESPLPTDEQAMELLAIISQAGDALEAALEKAGYQEITWVQFI